MTRESFATLLKAGAVVFLLLVFLFADGVWVSSAGFIGSALREVATVFRDSGTQWMVFLCLGIYFTAFLFLRSRMASGFWRAANPNLWLVCVLLISVVLYAINYSPSTQALTLLGGAVLGQGAAVWICFEMRNQKSEVRNSLRGLVVTLLVILLALASVWQTDAIKIFEYRGHTRWSGPWDNPNIFGLLMGVGIVLAIGSAVLNFEFLAFSKSNTGNWKGYGRWWKVIFVVLCLFAAILIGRGLLHSYSRGAWLAAISGLAYLLWWGVQSPKSKVRSRWTLWLKNNWFPLWTILIAAVILCFWQFQHTEHEHAVTRRVFSVANANDFSWRNRVAAWEGALQIMAEHPMLGAGWNQPERMYDNYYRQVKVDEAAAVQLNDYFMLGVCQRCFVLECIFGCL
jgi:hypothetical protein